MRDPEIVAKKLARIETCVRELREQARPELIADDVRERRFVEHTLQLAIQAAVDAASHIVAAERLGEPRDPRGLFDLLGRHRWIAPHLVERLRPMVGFRNVLVHEYDEVDLEVVRSVLGERLDDLLAYAQAVRDRLER